MTLLVALQDDIPERTRDLAAAERWLYVGDDAGRRIALERGLLAAVEPIELGAAIQEEAERLRRPFVDWVGGLSGENDSAEWWASELAARNSYTMLFSNLCGLAAARRAIAGFGEEPVLAVCSSRALAEELLELPSAQPLVPAAAPAPRHGRSGSRALRAWARLAPAPLAGLPGTFSSARRVALDGDPRYRRRVLASRGAQPLAGFSGDDTVLLFTWVDRRSLPGGGVYRDPHLGALPGLLRDRGHRVASVARVLHSLPFSNAVSGLLASREPIVFPDLHLDLDDWRRCASRANAFRLHLPEAASVGGVPVRRLALESVERYRSAQALALSYEPLVANLAAAGIRPAVVVHTYEGHAWELTLTRAAREHWPDARVIGYENLNMSRRSLSMYPAACELARRPLPDRIVTNGPAYARVLVEEGVPPERVRAGCALRHADLRERAGEPVPRTGEAIRVLVATDGEIGRAAELVGKAVTALGGRGAYAVTVKCHPLVPVARIRALLGDALAAANVRFAEAPVAELLADADVLLYSYTVVCYEALAQGVPPVFVHSETVVDLDHLEPFPELRAEARTSDEIRAAVDTQAALAGEALSGWRLRARAAVDDALAPVSAACMEAFVA